MSVERTETFPAGQLDRVTDEQAADEVDPELLNLPLSRRGRGRHPLVSAFVILLSLYLLYFVRSDLLYFFQANRPINLGALPAALENPQLMANSYVTLQGAPDRKHSVLIEGRLTGYESFFRLLQSKSRIYVEQHRAQRISDNTVAAEHTGRLLPIADLPYAQKLRQYFAQTMVNEHSFDFAALQAAAAAPGPTTLPDREGQLVQIKPDTLFWINVNFPGEWLIQFSKSVYPTAEEAAKQLAGLKLPLAADDEPSRQFWRFVVLASPTAASELERRFSSPLLNAGVMRRHLSYSARWSQLRARQGQLLINARDPAFPSRYVLQPTAAGGSKLTPVKEQPVRLPANAILHVSTSSPFQIPAAALVLISGERPAAYWHYLALYALLLGFIALNSVIIVRHFRRGED